MNVGNRATQSIPAMLPSSTRIEDYLHQMILQTKECMMDDRFELTRMADQVLPGLVCSKALSIPSLVAFKVSEIFGSGLPTYTVLDKAQ